MIRVMPARAAARILSLTPPTGSTFPRSVISPVMAMSRCTGIRVTAERRAVAMVIPAEGPSLGIAPSGTWMWMSTVAWKSGSRPNSSARERTYDNAARADSCITSPSLPVSVRLPLPRESATSVDSISPPTSVQASPVARPISDLS